MRRQQDNRLRPIMGNHRHRLGQVRHLQGVFVARLATLRQMQQANSCYLYVVKKLQRAHLLESAWLVNKFSVAF